MSEEFTLLSEEELLAGIATVGPPSRRDAASREKKSASVPSAVKNSAPEAGADKKNVPSPKKAAPEAVAVKKEAPSPKKAAPEAVAVKKEAPSPKKAAPEAVALKKEAPSPKKAAPEAVAVKKAATEAVAVKKEAPTVAESTPAPKAEQPVERPKNDRPEGKKPGKKTRKNGFWKTLLRIVGRTLLCLVVIVALLVTGLWMVLDRIFNGPSPAARDVLTMSLSEASGTKWLPGLFLGDEMVEQIRNGGTELFEEDVPETQPIVINTDTSLTANSDEWTDYPDGIRIEEVSGDTYNAYVMIIRDPSRVYLATSSPQFSMDIPGTRITQQIETEGASAAVNAGAFFDNGTSSPSVGSVPEGLVISGGKVVWNSGNAPEEGFVGFTQDNVLMVADTMTGDQAMELGIRDGCCFGPVLIQNGGINNEAYNTKSGYNPRTAIGQRADGAVILLCIDGRQAGSLGATYADIINVMVEYDAVNACNLDGGSSTVMLYRDTQGRYGEPGQVQMINNYSLLQEQPRKMPTFIMVRPLGEE